jgi:hypothetical protein
VDEIVPLRIPPPTVSGGERITLTTQQLDELERVSSVSLTAARVAELEELCSDHLIWRRFEKASSASSTAVEIFDDLQKQLDELITSVADVLGKETPQHHHVHVEINEHFYNDNSTGSAERALEEIMSLQRSVDRAYKGHKLIFGGRGRPRENEALRMFIWKLADCFENAGGRATAPYQGMLDKPDSPFARWVGRLNEYLPPEIRTSLFEKCAE